VNTNLEERPMSDQNERPLVPGNRLPSSPDVTEGGPPPASTAHGHGSPKPASSTAADNDTPNDDTSDATAGKAEKDHAAGAGAEKTQSGRGHRKD
jgi:hypothetical protein